MLCPEVWSFKEPASIATRQTINLDEPDTLNKLRNFHFNHLASVILPDSLRVPKQLTDTLDLDCDYYKIDNFKPVELLDKGFLSCFAQSGELTLLSTGTRIDCDTCLCVTSAGQLVINLDKESYQELGLSGTVSHFHSKDKSRYVVRLDLANLVLDKADHRRALECFPRLPKMNVIFMWKPPEANICPSSIAKFLSNKYKVQLCKLKAESNILYSLKAPDLSQDYDVNHLVEWLGMVCLEANLEPENDYVSSYINPEPNLETGQVRLYKWTGLLDSSKLEQLIKEMQLYVRDHEKQWCAVYVQGFTDSPVAWYHREHHYFTNGDNGYIVIVKPDDLLLITQECGRKKHK